MNGKYEGVPVFAPPQALTLLAPTLTTAPILTDSLTVPIMMKLTPTAPFSTMLTSMVPSPVVTVPFPNADDHTQSTIFNARVGSAYDLDGGHRTSNEQWSYNGLTLQEVLT